MRFYEFADFRIDSEERVLYRNSSPIPLAPKVFDTLFALVSRSGRVVSKDTLMEEIWQNTFVEENNLTQYIFTLRRILDEKKDGTKYIETISRRGYRFVPEVKIVEIENKVLSYELSQLSDNEIVLFDSDLPAKGKSPENEIPGKLPVERKPAESNNAAISLEQSKENREAEAADSFTYNKNNRIFFIAGVITACALMIFLGFAWSDYRKSELSSLTINAAPPQNITFKRLFPSLDVFSPNISPDGKYLVYGLAEKDGNSVWLKDMENGAVAVRILPTANKAYRILQFSPDAAFIYYLTGERNINRVPTFGGGQQEIVQKAADNGFAVSPDGKQIAFMRGKGLVVANVDGSGERVLAERNGESQWYASFLTQISWSPDGKSVVLSGGYVELGRRYIELLEISVADGKERRIATPQWEQINNVLWLPDGTGLLVTARERLTLPLQIWHLSYSSGAVRKITNDLHSYGWLSLTADSRTLVTEELSGGYHIWVGSLDNPNRAEQVTFIAGETAGRSGLAFTPDDKIVYNLQFYSSTDLWIMNADGSGQRPLTVNSGFWNARQMVTPDGRYIVFISTRFGGRHVWRIDADGGNLMQLTNGKDEDYLSLSPDGQWIYYTDASGKTPSIWKISINGGEPQRVSGDYWAGSPSVSPDGKLIAYLRQQTSIGSGKIGLMAAENGEILKTFDAAAHRSILHWTADSKAIIYIAEKSPNLWQQPIDGSPPVQLTDFDLEETPNFTVSPDHQKIAISRGSISTEAVMITNFK